MARKNDQIANADRIVYRLFTLPGGVDGMDSSDKGDKMVFATFYRSEAESKKTAWHRMDMIAISGDELKELRNKALNSLDPMERLAIGLGQKTLE